MTAAAGCGFGSTTRTAGASGILHRSAARRGARRTGIWRDTSGITLRDLPRGGTRRVDAAGLPTLFGAGDLLAARVLELDRRSRLAGGRLDFEPEDATEPMAALAQAHDGYLEDFPGSGWEDVLREHFDLFPAFLAHKAREPEASLTLADEFVDPFADLA